MGDELAEVEGPSEEERRSPLLCLLPPLLDALRELFRSPTDRRVPLCGLGSGVVPVEAEEGASTSPSPGGGAKRLAG
jgi:hypothetical protein